MEKDVDTGWRNYHQIADSRTYICGQMICSKCKEKIEGVYLIRERQNFKHRGNETDETYIYHRECSNNKSVWKKYDEDKLKQDAYLKLKESQIHEVLGLIKKYGLDQNDLFEDHEYY